MKKIVFVCLGNICRSPMAEALLREKIKQAGLATEIDVYSAATGSWEIGHPPHQGTQNILNKHQISFDGMKATQIIAKDFETYDLVVGMDHSNVRELKQLVVGDSVDKIHLFMSVVDGLESEGVPDPYYTGNFEETYRMVNLGTEAWLKYLIELGS